MSPSGIARGPPPLGPDVGAGGALAELERPLDDAEVRVDLERACLHAQRPRLERRAGVPVDDQRAHAAPTELIGEHQPGRAGSDDEDVGIHRHGPVSSLLKTPAATAIAVRILRRG